MKKNKTYLHLFKIAVFTFLFFTVQNLFAQTFDWESGTTTEDGDVNYGKIYSTVNGISVEVSSTVVLPGQHVYLLDMTPYPSYGASGDIVFSSVNQVNSITFNFTSGGPVDIKSIYAVETFDVTGQWTYTPTGGSNSPVIDNISASTGKTVSLNWTGVTSFIVTKSDFSGFGFDDMILGLSAPTTQATNVTFSNLASGSATLNWTRGNGDNCAVFIKAAFSGTASPVDGTTYTASTTFGSGEQIGTSGWYCVYSGNGATVDITGISNGTTYQVHVCEYNGSGGFEAYNSTSSTNNPNNEVLPVELTSFTAAVEENNVKLNWETATEVNNYGFEIERTSTPLGNQSSEKEWETLVFVEGHGNSNSPKSYEYIDNLDLSLDPSLSLEYRLKQIDTDGGYEYYSTTAKVEIQVTEVDDPLVDGGLPTEFALEQNYPNPFNPTTVINYSIPVVETFGKTSLHTTLIVYDLLGREVATLVNKQQAAGNYSVNFNASNLSSGMYIYRITAGNFVQSRKMLLLR